MNRKNELEPEDLSELVSYQVRLIQIAAYKNFESRTKGFGSLPRYFGLLRIIEAKPGTNQSRLAEAVCLDRSSLVPILDTLTKEGVIQRRPSEQDKRVRCVFLTDHGKELLAKLRVRVTEHEQYMVQGLSDKERDMLVGLLRRVSENLRSDAAAVDGLEDVA